MRPDPVNLEYDELFEATNLPVQITDQSLRTQHISARNAGAFAAKRIAADDVGYRPAGRRYALKRYSLRRGYVFWKEDISELNQLKRSWS